MGLRQPEENFDTETRIVLAALQATVTTQMQQVQQALGELGQRFTLFQETQSVALKDNQKSGDGEHKAIWEAIEEIKRWQAKKEGQLSIFMIIFTIIQFIMTGTVVGFLTHLFHP